MRVSPSQIRFLIEAGAIIGTGFFYTKKAGTHKPSLICKQLQTPCNIFSNLHKFD